MHAIQGITNVKGSAHLEALQRIETTLAPPTHSVTQPLPVVSNCKPVLQQRPRVQNLPTVPPNTDTTHNAEPPRVEEPVEFPRVENDDADQLQMLPSPSGVAFPNESIADRVKSRHRQPEPKEQ